jgi:hypothetical protein
MVKTFFLLIALLVFTQSVPDIQAHVLETDNTIGSIIHIDPEDDPIVGEPAHLYFDIKDKTDRFSLQACNCTVTIERNGGIMHTQEFTHTQEKNPAFEYTFPKKGVYEIVLSGTPHDGKSFDSFRHQFTFRVSRTLDITPTDNPYAFLNNAHTIHYVGIGIITVVFMGMLIKSIVDKKRA